MAHPSWASFKSNASARHVLNRVFQESARATQKRPQMSLQTKMSVASKDGGCKQGCRLQTRTEFCNSLLQGSGINHVQPVTLITAC
eukprot:363452-Chlamydomonas_euryale.AAC.2